MRKDWFVLKTETRRERPVQCQLRDLGIESYFPLLKTFKKRLIKGQRQIEPLFPGYLFALIVPEFDLFDLRQVRSFTALVCFDGRAARLDPRVIEDLRKREGGKGYICMRPLKQEFHLHDPVRIVDGPFSGHTGLFVRHLPSAERICLLLEVLKARALVEVPLSSVAASPCPPLCQPSGRCG